MFNKKSVVMFSVSLPLALTISASNINSKSLTLNQTVNPKFYNESTQKPTYSIINNEQKSIFESNFRIYVSAVSMYIADNNGKAPIRLQDVSKYLVADLSNNPTGAKYYISQSSDKKITLTGTYGDAVLNQEFDNESSDFIKDKFESNFNEGVRGMSLFIINNNGKMPLKISDINKYFDKDITTDPKGVKYTITKNAQRKTVFTASYKGINLQKVFDDKGIDEIYIGKLKQNHEKIVNAIKIYISEKNGSLPSSMNDISIYLDSKDNFNIKGLTYTFNKNNDGSLVFVSNYKDIKIEQIFYSKENNGDDLQLFKSNCRIYISAACMYVADNDGKIPTNIEELDLYLGDKIQGKPEGALYTINKNLEGKSVLVGTYKDLKYEFLID